MKQNIKDGTDKIVSDTSGTESSEPGDLTINGRLRLSQQANTASASTISLANNATKITGTTNIDKISTTNWQQGSVVVLVFEDVLDLQHLAGGSGQLFLKAGVDLTTAADMAVMFVMINAGVGANTWYQI